jgi:CRISPR/Cas system-associated exonuclease Cas4 (RecB family)
MNFKHVGCDIDYELTTETINGKRHYVTPGGNKYPSVTTITSQYNKQSIMEWRKRVGEEEANRISSKAAGRGTRVHTMCENYLNNQEDYLQKQMPDAIVMFKTLQPLLNEYVNNIHALEVPLYSDYLRTAGRVDCIAEFDGAISVIDFKTSSKPKEDKWIENYYMQCSAYAVMFEERTGIPVSRIVVMIAVDGEKAQIFVKKRNDYIDEFIKYRDIYEELTNDVD